MVTSGAAGRLVHPNPKGGTWPLADEDGETPSSGAVGSSWDDEDNDDGCASAGGQSVRTGHRTKRQESPVDVERFTQPRW